MLSNAARFLMVSAAASLVAFGAAPAEACSDLADAALDIIDSGASTGNGASFVTLAMKQAFGITGAEVRTAFGSVSPVSAQYYWNIISENRFTHITNVNDLAAGDVLSIDATSVYNGHSVILLGPATQLPTPMNPIRPNTIQWSIPIADATTAVHGCSMSYPDSRWTGACNGGTFTPGPGTAYMRLYSNLDGTLLGYSWSVTPGATYYDPAVRPYAVGRLSACSL
ncbi:uncharacterized protein SOCE26_011150 [Sorangium cellulosum]|uniref:Secreted protein n=1 Tax=Sorangium cellulosum TaxID=56 RepID=A0A2L0EK99_SORCE|nr:hypothetical protein [Sorangium cellulosum]AUX39720.1 uncharacterized protein SOCE26_011150 [Sorangium cellulosum]